MAMRWLIEAIDRISLTSAASPTFSRAKRVTDDRCAERLVGRGEHVLHRHLRVADGRLIGQHDLL